jgi:hypothetical protein
MTGTASPFTNLLPGAPAAPAPQQGPAPAGPPGRPGLRTQVLALAGAAVLVAAAVTAFLLLGDGSGGGVDAGPVVTHAGRTTAPTASATGSATVTTPAVEGTGRNPFVQPSGQAAGSGSAGTGTGTDGAITSVGAVGSVSTVTVTADPVYLGLYAFTGTKATFWVNDQSYRVDPGGAFAGFVYTGKSSATCARVTRSGTATTICTGNVTKIG